MNTNEDLSALELPDEEVLNMPIPNEESREEDDIKNENISSEESQEEKEIISETEEEIEEPVDEMQEQFNKAAANETNIEQEKGQEEENQEEQEKEEDPDPKAKKEVKDSKEAQESEETQAELDYKAEYEKLIAPFRANGKDMQINGVDDAITLMKMGANYNKKMAGLKPNLKLMKMLSNNELLDEEKLTYLIDLNKKDPQAIAKFIKESGIDPLDIDTEKDTEYKPGTYTVDDKEVELDMVLEEIQDTQSFDKTTDIIGNKWDDSSKRVVLAEPSLIKVINEHVTSGIYDQIMDVVNHEQALGRLTELSDLEAYKQVGDALQEQGVLTGNTQKETPPAVPVAVKTNTKQREDPKLNDRRRAASSPKSGGKQNKGPQFDPLSMSDEDFEKAAASLGL